MRFCRAQGVVTIGCGKISLFDVDRNLLVSDVVLGVILIIIKRASILWLRE
jgi:uncharacterized membrane protein HdeD (DUF308 family)